MNYLGANMKLIVECSQKLVRLGENLCGEDQKLDKAEPVDVPTMTTDFVKGHGLSCPKGYIFKDENGNVINTTKIVLEKKKPKYPKSYAECCEIMGFCSNALKWDNPFCINKDTYLYVKRLDNLIESFCKLLICRDAYWKIAGEEKELGRPWRPSNLQPVFSIGRISGILMGRVPCHNGDTAVLEFPTNKMRDAFYENFKELIVMCKELL